MVTTPNPVVAFHTASMFQQIDMGVLLRCAYDVFKEEEAATIMAWLSDMCDSHICGDPNAFKRILVRILCENSTKAARVHLAADLLDLQTATMVGQGTRLDWLMRLDVRMWKRAKLSMRQIYASLFTLGGEAKEEIGESLGSQL